MIDSESFTHKEYYRHTGTLSDWRIVDLLDYQDLVLDSLSTLVYYDVDSIPNIKDSLLTYAKYIPADKLAGYNKVLDELSALDVELVELNEVLESVSSSLV